MLQKRKEELFIGEPIFNFIILTFGSHGSHIKDMYKQSRQNLNVFLKISKFLQKDKKR